MADLSDKPKPAAALERILSNIQRLRPLPSNVNHVLRVLDDPRSTAGIVADLLSLDQALTAFILRAANSVSLGYASSCSSLDIAVMRLGFKQVRALVLSTVAAGPLTRRLEGYRLGNGELWQHSLITAYLSRWLAQAVYYPVPEEAYVAGLLHDMGKLLLDQFVVADYNTILELMSEQKMHLWQVEEHLFGMDHAAVGGSMATQWGFPAALVRAIHYHHAPSLAYDWQELAAIVNIANALYPAGVLPPPGVLNPPGALNQPGSIRLSCLEERVIHPEALRILKLSPNTVDKMQPTMLEALSGSEMFQPPSNSTDLLR